MSIIKNFKIFLNLNLSDAYLQIKIDKESKKLLGVNTHCGLFQYQQLLFGVKSVSNIFQKLINQMIAGIPIRLLT